MEEVGSGMTRSTPALWRSDVSQYNPGSRLARFKVSKAPEWEVNSLNNVNSSFSEDQFLYHHPLQGSLAGHDRPKQWDEWSLWMGAELV